MSERTRLYFIDCCGNRSGRSGTPSAVRGSTSTTRELSFWTTDQNIPVNERGGGEYPGNVGVCAPQPHDHADGHAACHCPS